MTKKLEQKLFNRFYFFHPEFPDTVSLMCYGFECEDGWFDLIWELCEEIEKSENIMKFDKQAKKLLLGKDDLNVFQVKEKYGGLRFYMDGCSVETQKIINKFEDKSLTICERCGTFGEIRSGRWVKVLCDKCNKERS